MPHYLLYHCVGHPIDLSCLGKLRSLSFNHMHHPAILSMLSKPAPSLKQVVFQVAFENPRSIQFKKYKLLDTYLCDPALQTLEGIRVDYVGKLHRETVEERVEQALCQVSERGILRIVKEAVRSIFDPTCTSLILFSDGFRRKRDQNMKCPHLLAVFFGGGSRSRPRTFPHLRLHIPS